MPARSRILFFFLWIWLLPSILCARTEQLFYYVPGEDSWQSLLAHAQKISILAPQVFRVNAEGQVTGAVEKEVRWLAAQYKIRLMPLLTNENFAPGVAHAVLRDQKLRQRTISESVRLCQENNCWGLQLDFEGVLPEDAPFYTQFVQEAAQAFHERHLRLSVAVISPLTASGINAQSDQPRFGRFGVLAHPYQFQEIAEHVDFLSLMAYDHHGNGAMPGPIAGYPWVERSIQFLLLFVPRQKLFLGMGFYARQWCEKWVSEMGYPNVVRLLGKAQATLQWDEQQRAPRLEFDGPNCRSVVWFENRRSLREKLRLLEKYRLAGFSAWRLGQEDPEFWNDLPGTGRD